MVTLLSRLFIKNRTEYGDPTVRRAYGVIAGCVGIFLNVCMFAGKYLAGILSGSIAVTADAFNNLSDAASSVITLLGFWLAGKRADREHPFGHGRIEYVSGLGVSMAILLMGLELLRSSAERVRNPSSVEMGGAALWILALSIAAKLYMAFLNFRVGGKIDSAAMRATGRDSLGDALSTIVVLAGGLAHQYLDWHVDGICGLLVALFILYNGIEAARETISPLLGRAPSDELVRSIYEIALSNEEILGIHDLIVHDYGPGRLLISFHGEVSGEKDVFTLHEAIDRTERELSEKLNCDAVIHMDPVAPPNALENRRKEEVGQMVRAIDGRLSIHDFHIATEEGRQTFLFDILAPYDFPMEDEEIKEAAREAIRERWKGCEARIKVDKS